ncbi:hypothetical protein SNEBB_006795 [Seison nebaliae]|nr:hypothetical protein SNEBB_006795 [Seison nebaliae]
MNEISKLSGPILADPGYGAPIGAYRSRPPIPPNKMNLELFGHSCAYVKRTPKKKNFIAQNRRRIHSASALYSEREETKLANEKKKEMDNQWQSSKYANVESKMKNYSPRKLECEKPSNFLRAHSRTNSAREMSRPSSGRISRSNSINFVKLNARNASRPSTANSTRSEANRQERKSELGTIPNYLRRRKDEWNRLEMERIANIPDPEQPPNSRKLGDEERQATLTELRVRQSMLLSELNTIPLRTDSLRLKNVKKRLLDQISEVDEEIEIFSRPKVFIHI